MMSRANEVRMNTYKSIDARYREKFGRTVKPCWIADVKETNGIALRSMSTRPASFKRKHPCPGHLRAQVEEVMRELGVLPPKVA
jgi:hypothetical protein